MEIKCFNTEDRDGRQKNEQTGCSKNEDLLKDSAVKNDEVSRSSTQPE